MSNRIIKLAKYFESKYRITKSGQEMYGSGSDWISNPPLGLYGIPYKLPITIPLIKNKKAVTDVTAPFVRELSEEEIDLGRKSWLGQRMQKPTSWHINNNKFIIIDYPKFGDVSLLKSAPNSSNLIQTWSAPGHDEITDSLVKQDSRYKKLDTTKQNSSFKNLLTEQAKQKFIDFKKNYCNNYSSSFSTMLERYGISLNHNLAWEYSKNNDGLMPTKRLFNLVRSLPSEDVKDLAKDLETLNEQIRMQMMRDIKSNPELKAIEEAELQELSGLVEDSIVKEFDSLE
jgi:hypothetical protein